MSKTIPPAPVDRWHTPALLRDLERKCVNHSWVVARFKAHDRLDSEGRTIPLCRECALKDSE